MDELTSTQQTLLELEKTLAPADLQRLQATAARIAELQARLPDLAAQHTAALAELATTREPLAAAEAAVKAAQADLTAQRNASGKVRGRLDSIVLMENSARLELERLQAELAAQLTQGTRPLKPRPQF